MCFPHDRVHLNPERSICFGHKAAPGLGELHGSRHERTGVAIVTNTNPQDFHHFAVAAPEDEDMPRERIVFQRILRL